MLCFQAKLGEEMLDYKDLAALPKTKAIYNIDRPDMLSYSPYVSYPSEERHYGEVNRSLACSLQLLAVFFSFYLFPFSPLHTCLCNPSLTALSSDVT